ncbi:MAG: iron-containing alcohol dehydrogenase [Sarcina sp.]
MNFFLMNPKVYINSSMENIFIENRLERVCVITDPIIERLKLLDVLENILKKLEVEYFIYSQIEIDPSIEAIKKGVVFIGKKNPKWIIALGGGSVIDSAKSIKYFLNRLEKKISMIAIPTTTGTGAEVTSYAVVTDRENNLKIPLKDNSLVSDIAILTNEFTKLLPKNVVADGGLDALTHSIEAYTSKQSNFYTRVYAREALRLIFKNLLIMYNDISNDESRLDMAKASCLAGISFDKSGLGINHSLAHFIGAKYHIPHGKSNGIILPYIIQYNSKNLETAKLYKEISKEIGLPALTIEEGVFSLIKWIEIMKEQMCIPKNLRELGIKKDEYMKLIPDIIEAVKKDICTSGNMRDVEDSELKKLIEELY